MTPKQTKKRTVLKRQWLTSLAENKCKDKHAEEHFRHKPYADYLQKIEKKPC